MKHFKPKSGSIFVTALALVVLLIPLAHGRGKPAHPVPIFKLQP